MKIVSLDKYKEIRRARRIKSDLDDILELFDVIIAGLNNYKKYKPVNEVIKLLKSNKDLLKLYRKKYNKIINANKN